MNMKKLIMILALAALMSCEKDEVNCYECITTTTSTEAMYYPTTKTKMHCNQTESEIKLIEKNGTFSKDTIIYQLLDYPKKLAYPLTYNSVRKCKVKNEW